MRGIQLLVTAVHPAVCHSQVPGRLSQPGVPRVRGIQPLVAAVQPAVFHGQASRVCEASSRSSQPRIQPFVTTRRPACARHPAACRNRASSRSSQPGVPRVRGIQPLVATVHPAVCHSQESCHHNVTHASSMLPFFPSQCLTSLRHILLESIRWYTWIYTYAPPIYTPSTVLVSFCRYKRCHAELANPSSAPPLLL